MPNNSMPNLNEIGNINDVMDALNSIEPSYAFGPDEAVLELIEDDISLLTDGVVTLNCEDLKTSAKEIGVSDEDFENTIDFLITIYPKIIYSYKKTRAGYVMEIDVVRFREFRKKTRILMKDAGDDTFFNGVAKRIGTIE